MKTRLTVWDLKSLLADQKDDNKVLIMCNGVASKAVDASPGTLTELDGETMDVATFMIANVDMDTYEQQ